MAPRPRYHHQYDDDDDDDGDDDDEPAPERGPDGRWPTLDRIEVAIRQPGPFGFHGAWLDELLERRAATERELAQADRDLAEATARRRRLTRRVEQCNLAITGTSQVRDRCTGEVLQRLGWTRRIPFTDPQPEVDPGQAQVVSGRRLSDAVIDLLRVTDQVLAIPEIERLLRLGGRVPAGRAAKSISDALRRELAAGRVVRVRRGCYRAA